MQTCTADETWADGLFYWRVSLSSSQSWSQHRLLRCLSVTHKRERWIWFPLSYALMKTLRRLAAVRDANQAGDLRGNTTIYCLEFCAGFNDAKRQHLSTINTTCNLSFTTIQQQTCRRKQLMHQSDNNSLTAYGRKKANKVLRGRKYKHRKTSRKTHSTNGVNIESRVT